MTEQATEQAVRLETESGVAWITLNRPERRNAVNRALRGQLAEAVKSAERDPAVRVVVLTGAGGAFCSGADVQEFATREGTDEAALAEYTSILTRLRNMPKPVIAAVNGPAAGIGASFAMAADLRIATPEAFFVEAFVKIGLTVDGGASWLMPRLIGPGKALEMFMTGRQMGAEEAERCGLVNRVVPGERLLDEARELAGALAAGPADALAAIKRSVNFSLTSGFEEALEFEFLLQGVQAAGADFREGVTAFLEKRPPKFGQES